MPTWRKLVCGVVITALPSGLMSQDTGTAMLHHQGGVLINRNPSPASSALFMDDQVETQEGFEAKLDVQGSTATIRPVTVVQFEGNLLNLEHGAVSVSTSRKMTVRVGCLTTTPINQEWTQYDVTDGNGKIIVAALKNDVEVESTGTVTRKKNQPPDRVTVHEGEQKSFDEKCAVAAKPPSYVDAKGPILSDPLIKWPLAIGIGVTTCLIVCRPDLSQSDP